MLTIVKLGGSVLTDKTSAFNPNLKAIYKISKEIGDFLLQNEKERLVVVHGGGSYPHNVASRYEFGRDMDDRKKIGISLTSWAARKLNDIITEAFIDYGIVVFPLQPSSCIFIENQEVKFFLDPIQILLEKGFTPIMYGDIIFSNSERTIEIFSGERVILELAKRFHPDRVLFGTCVPGVFSELPEKNRDYSIIPKITQHNLNEVLQKLKKDVPHDVTGSMYHKVELAYEIAKLGIPCKIIDVQNDSIFEELTKKNIRGTEVVINNEKADLHK